MQWIETPLKHSANMGRCQKTILQEHISTLGLVHIWSEKVCHMFCHSRWKFSPTIRCLFIAFLLLIHYVSMWPWPFDLDQWLWRSHTQSLHQVEDPVTICSWVMSSDTSHRIILTMRLQTLRMRRITRPMRRTEMQIRLFYKTKTKTFVSRPRLQKFFKTKTKTFTQCQIFLPKTVVNNTPDWTK